MQEFEDLKSVLPERYAVLREIGRGGMATVYLAEERHPKRRVAIKVLHEELGARLGRARFVREVDVLSKLNHPHVVPIFAAGGAEGRLYYVMPFQEGETLRERINREGQLPLDFALTIAAEVADALAYAHRNNVVHRDVKPENILISDGHAVVADFGIARAVRAAKDDELTETGLSVGTPSYMSPEQSSLGDAVDGRSDIYALGCVLYEMLAGDPPFTGRTPQAVMARHAVDPVPRLRTVRQGVSEEVERVVLKALAKSPADRFASAADLREALRTATAVAHLEATTPTDAVPSWSGRRGGRRMRWVVAVMAMAGLFGASAIWWPRSDAGPARLSATTAFEDSVAVMPFTAIGEGEELSHISAGLTYEIISHLAQFGRLKVTARTSVMALARANLTARQIADSLGVQYLVEGSVQRAGDRLRITAELVDARSGAILWSSQYRSGTAEVLTVQESIAREVGAALLSTVGLVEEARPGDSLAPVPAPMPVPAADPTPVADTAVIPRDPPGHSAAHEPYIRGRDWLGLRTPEGFREAIVAFTEAVRADSTFAPAFAGLASAHALSVTYRYRIGENAYQALGMALAFADRAIALDALFADAYSARGYAASVALAPLATVRADFDRALALKPNSPDGPAWSGHLLIREGRFEEALAAAQRAVILDPLAASRRISLAYEALRDRRYDLAIEQARVAEGLAPGLVLPTELKARALLLQGQARQCAMLDLGPHAGLRAACLYSLGQRDQAAAIVDSLEDGVRLGRELHPRFTNVMAAQDLASYYGWIGDVENAVIWIENAFAWSPSGVDLRTVESGMFDRVRGDNRFEESLARLRAGVWPRVQAERTAARERGLTGI